MVEGSQHDVQIMENQSGFDLNDALLRWRHDLAGQPGIAAEDIRELETHLRETFSAFQRRGLSDPEAFAKAREKLGPAAQLGVEFAKAHQLRIWRDRVFWIALVGCVWMLPFSAVWPAVMELKNRLRASLGTPPAAFVHLVVDSLPFLLICAVMGSGYSELIYRKFRWFFVRRWRLAAGGVLVIAAANWFTYPTMGVLLIYELGFLGFAVLVLPPELKAAAKRVGIEDWRNSIGVWRDRLFWVVLSGLGIAAWTSAVEPGAETYFLRLQETGRTAPKFGFVLYFLIWLGPMGLAGLGIWTGHLSVISRALRSRRRVALIGGALVLMVFAQKVWLSTWNVAAAHLAIDWKFDFMLESAYTLFAGLISIAVMIWLLPWDRERGSVEALKRKVR
jgi:hypothetical protein